MLNTACRPGGYLGGGFCFGRGADRERAKRAYDRGNDPVGAAHFALVKNDSEQVMGAVAVARDITSRYLSESALRKRVAELEQQVKALSHGDCPKASEL